MLDAEQAEGLARRVVSESSAADRPSPAGPAISLPQFPRPAHRRRYSFDSIAERSDSNHSSAVPVISAVEAALSRAEEHVGDLAARAATSLNRATTPIRRTLSNPPPPPWRWLRDGADAAVQASTTRFVFLNHRDDRPPEDQPSHSGLVSLARATSSLSTASSSLASPNDSFPTNFVSTAKYRPWNALPLFLYEQFSRTANLYFLIIGILFTIDAITPVPGSFSKFAGLVSLALVVGVSGIKEAIEDLRRHREDNRVNRLPACVLSSEGECVTTTWGQIRVGDILLVRDKDHFPADMVLLSTSSDDGLAYVETKGLDGESNLKVKTSIPGVADILKSERDVGRLVGHVECDIPNDKIYQFSGVLLLHSDDAPDSYSLSPEQLLVRGSSLQNTDWVMGLVVYSGRDSKLMKNTKARPQKTSRLERRLNYYILLPVLLQVVLVLTMTTIYAKTCHRRFIEQDAWYLRHGEDDTTTNLCSFGETLKRMGNYMLLLSSMVPIGLYMSIEVVRAFQAYQIHRDDKIFNKERDIRCDVRTSSVHDEPGMTTHIFSDKTGTLTANHMVFKKCVINGKVFSVDDAEQGEDILAIEALRDRLRQETHDAADLRSSESRDSKVPSEGDISDQDAAIAVELFRVLSLCHTVIPEEKVDNEGNTTTVYQAASPDESALVHAGGLAGFCFVNRTSKVIRVTNPQGVAEEWEILGVLEFSSTRKRMSIIVRSPVDQSIRLYCKGADSVVLPRAASGQEQEQKFIAQGLDTFAAEGLRTLCLGYRILDQAVFQDWIQDHTTAKSLVNGRDEAVAAASELIERELILLGCTAIEDKLQDGVPETLQDLMRAGIKLWILTGDKQETAINIGLSCGILDEDMDVVILNELSVEDTQAQVDKTIGNWLTLMTVNPKKPLGLVIDGGTLNFALNPDLERKFMLLCEMAKAVVACRVSPKQKTEVVELVRRHRKNAVTLAIGDGPNDVGMIQAAHVGVGIVGVEGVEAKLVSDISIAQFEYLRRVVLVHGRWCYKRLSRMVLYLLYKNLLGAMLDFFVSFNVGFSGTPTFDPIVAGLFNIFLTPVPPICIAVVDQDISADYALMFPEIYRTGQSMSAFSVKNFLWWAFTAIWHSLVVFYFPVAGHASGPSTKGRMLGFFSLGTTIFTCLVTIVHVYLAVYVSSWTWLSAAVFLFSGTMWFWVGYMYSSPSLSLALSPPMVNVVNETFAEPKVWVILALVVLVTSLPTVSWKYIKRNYRPNLKTLAVELMRRGITREEVLGPSAGIRRAASLPTFHRRERIIHPSGFNFDMDDLGAILRSQYRPDMRRIRMRFLKNCGSDTELDVAGVKSAGVDKRETHRRAHSDGGTLTHPLLREMDMSEEASLSPRLLTGSLPVPRSAPRTTPTVASIAGLQENPRRRRPPKGSVHFDETE